MMQTDRFTTLVPARRRHTKFTPEKVQQIRDLVERGKRLEEIAELIGVIVGSLQVTCSRLGVSLRPHSNNGTTRETHSGGGSVSLQLIKEQPQQNSQFSPVEQAQAITPHQERARTNGVELANLALRMQYRGDDRTIELPLTQDTIRQLAFEAQFRDISLGDLVGDLIIAIMKKELFQEVLESSRAASFRADSVVVGIRDAGLAQ
jgi:hypothetical protein